MRIAELAGLSPSAAVRACYARLDVAAPDDYRQLAALLVDQWRRHRITTVGIGGGQGAGKSTLGRLLMAAGEHFELRLVVLSIDDFYLSKAERHRLAGDVHPLFATRGPPGTHAVDWAQSTLSALCQPGAVTVPRFDKGIDDRVGEAVLEGPVDIVVLEGWCVGAPAKPGSESERAQNALERDADAGGRWRRAIDDALAGPYAALNGALDALVFLQVPGLDAVRRWRMQQEGDRPPAQRMSSAQVAHFVDHYERITRRMLASLPDTADVLVELGEDHRIAALRMR